MSIITIFSGIFCNEKPVIQDILESTGYTLITDESIVKLASGLSNIPAAKINRSFLYKTSVFNKFTLEKERSIAYLRQAAAQMIDNENLIISGFCGMLIPRSVTHAMRVCLVGNNSFRIQTTQSNKGITNEEAEKKIADDDQNRSAWIRQLYNITDPWDAGLYDIVVPMDKTNPPEAAALIKQNLLKGTVRSSLLSQAAVHDFKLATHVEAALVDAGHNVNVTAENGDITLTINQKVLMLSRLEKELMSIVEKLPGVNSITTETGESNQDSPVYRKYNFEMPSKVLLVDDEREFVQTLSERLEMRDMGSVVAYDGPSALNLVQNDDPEVMIIDLKLPGMDGMEILSQVKKINPEIEVIMLTGHGSEQDKIKCMELGAFEYLQKPVDINILSQILKQAHEKIRNGQ